MDSPLELKPYQVVDIYGEYRVSKRAVFFADLRNILSATYFDVAGFNTRGRNFMSGLRFQF
jgi:outer membrane receptor protein involved in Fe transport